MAEAAEHPHARARSAFTDVGGIVQPAPAPRFGRSPAGQPAAPPRPGADTDSVLAGLGLSAEQTADLRARGVVG
jgi:alpha-methylacyl-CoA racemase